MAQIPPMMGNPFTVGQQAPQRAPMQPQVPVQPQSPMQMQQQPQQMPSPELEEEQEPTDPIMDLETVVNSVNVAENLSQEELDEIASDLHASIKQDERSMEDWFKKYNDYLELAMQIKKKKTFPWPNAANIKFPILTIAALQFQARAYPALVDGKSIVKGRVVGYDPSGNKALRAERIGKHMTYQLMDEIENWDEDMDRLCLLLPIAGCVFKDIGWDSLDEKIFADLVLPTDMIIDYWAASMEDARRITRKLYFFQNTIIEKQRDGIFLDVELSPPPQYTKTKEEEERQARKYSGGQPSDTPYTVYKCQTYLDLDNDGYKEPYIVLLTEHDKKILRISPNFSLEDVKKNAKGDIVKIRPKKNFVKYDMFPSPDGGLLGVGFGLFLGSLNEVVNSSINQLLDQGTMLTTSGGFLAKGIKLKGGRMSFEPNEWKVVPTTGDDLRKGVVPLPIREPSEVLLKLLLAIDQKSTQIPAISEISTGKLPGQNTPATTTISSIEEGMKVFTAVYKRIHRQLKKEFRIIFNLNKQYLTEDKYFAVLDSDGTEKQGMVSLDDYKADDLDVIPDSDPNVASAVIRLLKAQALLELIPLGAVDPAKAGQRILIAMDQPNPQELMPQPQPDPKMAAMQAKAQMDQQKSQMEMQIKGLEAKMDMMSKMLELKFQEQEMQMKLGAMQQTTAMSLRSSEMKHQQQLRQQQEKKAAGMNKGKNGDNKGKN